MALADAGLRVLLVSTDPASNLSDVFEMATGEDPVSVASVEGLDVVDIDPEVAADEYRSRVIDPYRGVLPDSEVAALEEKLAGACTVEVAAFDTFARLLAEPAALSLYDHVVFDTAPTGHTLRLLSLPAAWSDYLGADPDATSCLGPLGGLQDHRPVYAAAVNTLQDAAQTSVVLVVRPEPGALAVAATAAAELHGLGIDHQTLIVNGVLAHPLVDDPVAAAYAAEQHRSLERLPPPLDRLAAVMVPLVSIDVVGVPALRSLTAAKVSEPDATAAVPTANSSLGSGLSDLVKQLEESRRGVILVAGKGGVGKTTVARIIAVELARRGHRVELSTTDPASLAPTVDEDLPTLTTSAIDPEAVTRDYITGRLDAAAKSGLDPQHVDLLAEDLRSPCSQEMAVFQAFRQVLRKGRDEFVVIDTAPTGHTLLLLDVTGSFHRQVMQDPNHPAGHVVTPLMWLQDPDYSRVLIVTLPETIPVSEAADLQEELRRAGIEPFGWVVNASLASSGTKDPVLNARGRLEQRQLGRIVQLTPRVWTLPWSKHA